MAIQTITLKNFRCFKTTSFNLINSIILIKGKNGSGKTSLLEAVYFAGYLKSFRTYANKELIYYENKVFHINLRIKLNEEYYNLSIGLSLDKKLVKVNNKKITSYEELFSFIRIICMSEDDLFLIKGPPEERRKFLDSALLIHTPESSHLFKKYRKILANRNALLKKSHISRDMYELWTQKLWLISQKIRKMRKELLNRLEISTNDLVKKFIPDCPEITTTYQAKKENDSLDEIFADQNLFEQEKRMKRGIIGAHLDDILISFNQQSSKTYSSRGQQKLTALMLKIAHIKDMQESNKPITAFLLDDFMTDFDESRINQLLPLLTNLKIQLIFTIPTSNSVLEKILDNYDIKKINLT